MQDKVRDFYRQEITNGLSNLNEGCADLFRRMYSHKNPDLSIEEIVDKIPEEKVDWALSQVERSLRKPELLKLVPKA